MAMHHEALNPLLYRRMLEYYGEDNVEIVSPGQEIEWKLVWVRGADGERRPARQILASGEEYRTRCRRCRDWRARLHINHRWGVPDPETGSKHLHLIQCFNEQCYSTFQEQKQLYELLYGSSGRRRTDRVVILPGVPAASRELHAVDPPGPVWPLEALKQRHPNHEAITYLEGRGFDPVKLSRMWGVGYCPESRYDNARNRIIIPIYQQGMLVMWQARYIGDSVGGVPFNKARVAKYWTSPGAARKLVAYNLERALRHKTVVIIEGPSDVWNQGPMCIGAVGKTLGPELRKQIAAGVKAHGDEGSVIVALDPKQDPRDALRNRPHHLDRLVTQMQEMLPGRVVPLWLPEEYDPGSLHRDVFRAMAKEAAAKLNIPITFGPPVKAVCCDQPSS